MSATPVDIIAAHRLKSTTTVFYRDCRVRRPECTCGWVEERPGDHAQHVAEAIESGAA